MSKKKYLELLIKTFGLVPYKVKHYRTDGADGQYKITTGWEIIVHDQKGNLVFGFDNPEGFNDTVKEILDNAIKERSQTVIVED